MNNTDEELNYILSNEEKGTYYLSQIVKDGWEVAHTDDIYNALDCTISKGEKSYTCELKVRYNAGRYQSEGLLLDKKKYDDGKDYYLEVVEKDGTAYLITRQQIEKGLADGIIKNDDRLCNKHSFRMSEGKVNKNNLLIPIELWREFNITPLGQ
jgi:hypothetical protein